MAVERCWRNQGMLLRGVDNVRPDEAERHVDIWEKGIATCKGPEAGVEW